MHFYWSLGEKQERRQALNLATCQEEGDEEEKVRDFRKQSASATEVSKLRGEKRGEL